MLGERLDRQLRIEGWDQSVLEQTRIGVVGDDDLLASMFIMSASALGLNNMVVLAPRLDRRFLDMAKGVNPELDSIFLEGFYVHSLMEDLFSDCKVIVDLSRYGMANKLLLERAFRENIPVMRGFYRREHGEESICVFTYMRGREWEELERIVSLNNLPADHFDDGVFDIIASGIILEEAKNLLMGGEVSESLITYRRKKETVQAVNEVNICVVGAGALGNFVGLGLVLSGFRNITFMDPDLIETVNLNRQVLFYDAVGSSKSETLSARLNDLFGASSRSRVEYFDRETDISTFDIIFDCTDNFETRIIISERCEELQKIIISGGTSVEKGQVVVYDPLGPGGTPARVLGLYDIVDRRKMEQAYRRERASCTYRPDPSVIMSNQIIAGLMVDSCRILLEGQEPANIFYDSTNERMIRVETIVETVQ
jgi:molybdopterin/thiamine biosynthesis adenylyltransferase